MVWKVLHVDLISRPFANLVIIQDCQKSLIDRYETKGGVLQLEKEIEVDVAINYLRLQDFLWSPQIMFAFKK